MDANFILDSSPNCGMSQVQCTANAHWRFSLSTLLIMSYFTSGIGRMKRKNPRSELWSEEVKAAVEMKEASWKDVKGCKG